MRTGRITIAALAAVIWTTALPALAAQQGGVVEARPGAGEVRDLAGCVSEALANNDALQAERLRRDELDGQMYQALATGLPYVDATGEWARSRDPSFALDETFGGGGDDGPIGTTPLDTLLAGFDFLPSPEDIPAQTYWRAQLNLRWTLNPSKVLGAVGAAGQSIKRQELAIQSAIHQVEEGVVTGYHGIILASESLAATRADLANQAEFLEIMRMRFELGMATGLDTLQAAVAVANLVPAVHTARKALRNAGARLNAGMGLPPDMPLSIRHDQTLELEAIDSDSAVSLAMRRPEVGMSDLLTDMLKQNRKAQKAEMRPYLSVDGSYGYVGRKLKDLDDTGHDFWRATVALNVPLFDGLLTKGLVNQTEAQIRRNEVETGGLKRTIRADVLELLDALEVSRENLHAAELNLTRSEDLLETSKLELRLGRTDYLTVLQSEASRSLARSNLIQARYDVLTTTASLKRAIGVSPMLPFAAVEGLVEGGAE
ncbi:TolC family protein [bacterium]|nr:TolC family protein [bacterium]